MFSSLADAIFWIAVGLCSIAQIAIVRSVLISPTGSSSVGRRLGEIAWAVLPGFALAALFVFTWRAMHGPGLGIGIIAAVNR